MLTTAPSEACAFLGLDFAAYSRGFSHESEVFQWITSCRFFQASIFTSLNYQHRQRAVKRPFYQRFLDHINVDSSAIRPACEKVGEILVNLQPEAVKYFSKQEQLLELKRQAQHRHALSQKFGAALFMAHGLKGSDLGAAIAKFKKLHADNFAQYLEDTSAERIKDEVDEFCLAQGLTTLST